MGRVTDDDLRSALRNSQSKKRGAALVTKGLFENVRDDGRRAGRNASPSREVPLSGGRLGGSWGGEAGSDCHWIASNCNRLAPRFLTIRGIACSTGKRTGPSIRSYSPRPPGIIVSADWKNHLPSQGAKLNVRLPCRAVFALRCTLHHPSPSRYAYPSRFESP